MENYNASDTIKLEKPNEWFSNKAVVVSFVLSIFVISIHANNLSYYGLTDASGSLAYQFVKICADIIGGIAVPFFFTLSGYWFFRMDVSSPDLWKNILHKCKKKVKTLVIPYLLWNAFGTTFYMIITNIPSLAALMNDGNAIPITLQNILGGVLLHEYYFTFWYMQDLIVLSFVFVWLLALCFRFKALIWLELAGAVIMTITGYIFPFMCGSSSLLSFSIGAVLAVYARKFFEMRYSRKLIGICFVLFVVCCVIRYIDVPKISGILTCTICPLLLWVIADLINIKKLRWFYKQSFFIYASHVIPVTIVGHVLTWVSTGSLWVTFAYIIAVAATVAIIWMVSKMFNRYLPRFYSLVCGER